jgi:hypothetical protein
MQPMTRGKAAEHTVSAVDRTRVTVCLACVWVAWAWAPCARVWAAAGTWTVQSTPTLPAATSSALPGVSCSSPRECTAVGHYTSRAGVGVVLAERNTGAGWSTERTAVPSPLDTTLLFGVACPSRRNCVAVGSLVTVDGHTVPLAEQWHGGAWAIRRTPMSASANRRQVSYLADVSCPSPHFCAAVGYSGTRAGTAGVPLAEIWSGTRWAPQPIPDPPTAAAAFLSGVSCTAPDSCVAAGLFNDRAGRPRTLVERWDGAQWVIEPSPTPAAAETAQLEMVSCSTPAECLAVGYFTVEPGIEVPLAERWDGSDWSIAQVRTPHGYGARLDGVSCAAAATCVAVGSWINAAGATLPLAESASAQRWSILETPRAAGTSGGELVAISCPSKGRCTATGDASGPAGNDVALVEQYQSSR